MQRIYFDNAATTPVDEEVLDAMLPYLRENFGNASSIHSFGKSPKVIVEDTRDEIAEFLGSKPKEIVFTSGGTESNNFAIKGLAYNHIEGKSKNIITSTIEHLAVLETIKYLESRFGFNVTYIKPEKDGSISPDKVIEAMNEDTLLISVMHSNNETGVINDIQGFSEKAAEKGIYIHTDSIQSIGKTNFNVKDVNINFAAISAHKIYGPKGIGAVYIKDNTPVDKLIHGGSQEREFRGGTENIASIAGFGKAIELIKKKMEEEIKNHSALKNRILNQLTTHYGTDLINNSDSPNCLPNILNISFDPGIFKIDSEMLLIQLDLKGLAVSAGSACTSGSLKPSHVLLELGRDEMTALSSIRISFGRYNTIQEADRFTDAVKELIEKRN